jgi:SAM-dependent methyltransferase
MNTSTEAANAKEIDYWNGDAGEHWVQQADGLDFVLSNVGEAMLKRSDLRLGERVLDIGCGSGAITFAAQDRVGNTGVVMGLDVSRPLILKAQKRATERTSRATFILGDAANWGDEMKFDALVSRFGIMFFDDPVSAFSNLRHLSKRGGRLNFACWCKPKDCDLGAGLMTAVASLFKTPETSPNPTAPGPYALADRTRIASILTDAGWRDLNIERWEGSLPLPGSSVRESALFAARLGSLGRLMREQSVPVERVADALIPFLEQRIENGRVALRGAAWLVTAQSERIDGTGEKT